MFSAPEQSVQSLLAAGVQALQEGEWLTAQQLLGQALAEAKQRSDDLGQVRALMQLARAITPLRRLQA